MESNALKLNYNKEIRENNRIGHLVKTNPIYLAPRFILGVENEFEKTNPIARFRLEIRSTNPEIRNKYK
jgi:hypothetical protein